MEISEGFGALPPRGTSHSRPTPRPGPKAADSVLFGPMICNYHSYNLAFRHPFTISRGTKTHQPTLIVELEHRGLKGYGEAPAITYYHLPVEKMIADLEEK